MKYYLHRLIVSAAVFLTATVNVIAQANPDPCTFPDVTCKSGGGNGIVSSFASKKINYPAPGRSIPFWLAYGDTLTNSIDTDSLSIFSVLKISGPGVYSGYPGTDLAVYSYLNDLTFSESGIYEMQFLRGAGPYDTVQFTVLEEENFCVESPGGDCVSSGGDEIYAKPKFGNVIPVDAVFPIAVGVIESSTQMLDSSFSGTIYVEKVSGPGILYGSLSMSGKKWFDFENFKFSEPGDYVIRFHADSGTVYKPKEIQVEVISTTEVEKVVLNASYSYPNPFQNRLNIEMPFSEEPLTVCLYDYTGKIVVEQKVKPHENFITINTESLKTGLFVLNIKSATFQLQNSIVIKQ